MSDKTWTASQAREWIAEYAPGPASAVINVRVPDGLLRKVEKLAEARGATVSDLVRAWIDRGAEDEGMRLFVEQVRATYPLVRDMERQIMAGWQDLYWGPRDEPRRRPRPRGSRR